MLEVMDKDKNPFTPADGPEIDTLFLIDRGIHIKLLTHHHFYNNSLIKINLVPRLLNKNDQTNSSQLSLNIYHRIRVIPVLSSHWLVPRFLIGLEQGLYKLAFMSANQRGRFNWYVRVPYQKQI